MTTNPQINGEPDDALVELITREQRGVRRVLMAGMGAVLLMIAMSGALAFYYYEYAQKISSNVALQEQKSVQLATQAFETRRKVDESLNRLSDVDAFNRGFYEEVRLLTNDRLMKATFDEALAVATTYLQRGARSFAAEGAIESQLTGGADSRVADFFKGIAALQKWERNRGSIAQGATGLPPELVQAEEQFQRASADPRLTQLAYLGLANIYYLDAASQRLSYSLEGCGKVFAALDAAGGDEKIGPQPLYWRGQCYRKLGRTSEALGAYSLALRKSVDENSVGTDTLNARRSELTLQMNAFHGLGTVMIATGDLTNVSGLENAERTCKPEEFADRPPETRLAYACLMRAINLRAASLGQTANQVSGSGENLSFVFLREGNAEEAFKNASAVHTTGYFAWNELMLALTAERTGNKKTAAEARQIVALYPARQFNLCELRALLSEADYADAVEIVGEGREGFEAPVCGGT
jgi:tetratricopeptide (TPR) repeat protein